MGFCRRSFSGSIRCWFVLVSLWSQLFLLEWSALEQQVSGSIWKYCRALKLRCIWYRPKEDKGTTTTSYHNVPKALHSLVSSRRINIHRCPCCEKKRLTKRPEPEYLFWMFLSNLTIVDSTRRSRTAVQTAVIQIFGCLLNEKSLQPLGWKSVTPGLGHGNPPHFKVVFQERVLH